jgi:hypothetical protein
MGEAISNVFVVSVSPREREEEEYDEMSIRSR